MAKEAWSLPLWFECLFVVVSRLLVLLEGMVMVVVASSGSGNTIVCNSTSFLASVIHELPVRLDGARYRFVGPGCEGVVDNSRGNYVVVNIHKFYDVFTNMYPSSIIQKRSSRNAM